MHSSLPCYLTRKSLFFFCPIDRRHFWLSCPFVDFVGLLPIVASLRLWSLLWHWPFWLWQWLKMWPSCEQGLGCRRSPTMYRSSWSARVLASRVQSSPTMHTANLHIARRRLGRDVTTGAAETHPTASQPFMTNLMKSRWYTPSMGSAKFRANAIVFTLRREGVAPIIGSTIGFWLRHLNMARFAWRLTGMKMPSGQRSSGHFN